MDLVSLLTSQSPLRFIRRRGLSTSCELQFMGPEVEVCGVLGSLSLSFPLWRLRLDCLCWSCVLWAVAGAARSWRLSTEGVCLCSATGGQGAPVSILSWLLHGTIPTSYLICLHPVPARTRVITVSEVPPDVQSHRPSLVPFVELLF